GIVFTPESRSRANQQDELRLMTHDAAVTALDAGLPIVARVTLMDGRMLTLSGMVEPPRPKITLLSKSVSAADSASLPMIHLANSDELGQDSRLIFFLKTEVPDSFPASEKIEVATADEAFHVLLSLKDGNLTLQDSKTVFAM